MGHEPDQAGEVSHIVAADQFRRFLGGGGDIAAGLADRGEDFSCNPFLKWQCFRLVATPQEEVQPLLGKNGHILISSRG